MSAGKYHGPQPVTKTDVKMAKDHLKRTYKLNKDKIKDHQDAMKSAQKSGNTKSVAYNRAHLAGHQQDNQKIQQSMKTANRIQPVKKSPGLSNFVAKTRVGAKAISKLSGVKS